MRTPLARDKNGKEVFYVKCLVRDKEIKLTPEECVRQLYLDMGPGMIARHIARSAKTVIATDFSPKMIETAQKKAVPENVSFELADAADLRFSDKSFDAVIIASLA